MDVDGNNIVPIGVSPSNVLTRIPDRSSWQEPWETMDNETPRAALGYDWGTLAVDALPLARLMPPGPERNEALKLASLLRCAADARGLIVPKRGRPRK